MSYDASIRVSTIIDVKDVERAEKEVDRLAKKLDSVRARSAKLEMLGGTEKQFESLGYDAQILEEQLEKATLKAEELRSAFNKQNDKNVFSRATQSAKNLFSSIRNGTEKSNKVLATMASMFRRIMMRMILMKAIVYVINSIKTGIDNLVHYSTDLNGAFSDLKSSSVQLKNNLATAFAPILTMIIPYITQLIGWLNTAMNYIAQFWAILGGKSTYTKAKKQVVDYAKSLGDASKEAKGALAAFDEINVLDKKDSAGGGEATGAGAFEEVPVDSEFAEMIDRVKVVLEAILPLVILIGAALLAWKIYDFLSKLMLAHPLLGTIAAAVLALAGMVLAVYSYFKMWTDGVDWLGIIGYVAGVTIAVTSLYMLFGLLVAGIALIVAAIAGVVLAIKDIIENGVTAQNMGLLAISIIGILTGVFLAFGTTATVILGIITAVVGVFALLVSYSGNGAEALKHLKDTFKALGDFVKKVFAGDFKGALDDLKKAGKSFGNFFISVAEGIANGFIKMVNAIIDAINSIKIDVPGWLQALTGMQSFGFSLPHWNAHVSLPRLATGGIVTSSTIANIGERGREAVLPLENNTEWMDQLSDRVNSGRAIRIVFTGDLAELGRVFLGGKAY